MGKFKIVSLKKCRFHKINTAQNLMFFEQFEHCQLNIVLAPVVRIIYKVVKMCICLLDQKQINIKVEDDECIHFVFIFYSKLLHFT